MSSAGMPNIQAAVNAQRVHNRGSDIPSAVTHYLIVEGVTNGKQEQSPYESFKATFVQQLQTKIPSIAIAWGKNPKSISR